jgi:hypothetical protein
MATFLAVALIAAVITPAIMTVSIATAAVGWSRIRIVGAVVRGRGIVGVGLDDNIARNENVAPPPPNCPA